MKKVYYSHIYKHFYLHFFPPIMIFLSNIQYLIFKSDKFPKINWKCCFFNVFFWTSLKIPQLNVHFVFIHFIVFLQCETVLQRLTFANNGIYEQQNSGRLKFSNTIFLLRNKRHLCGCVLFTCHVCDIYKTTFVMIPSWRSVCRYRNKNNKEIYFQKICFYFCFFFQFQYFFSRKNCKNNWKWLFL